MVSSKRKKKKKENKQKQACFSIQKPVYSLSISMSGEAYESHTLYFSQIFLLAFVC